MGSNNLLLTKARPTKRIRTTNKVSDTVIKKNRVKAKIPLQQVLILLLKRKKRIPLTFNTFSIKEKTITLADVSKNKLKN